MARGNTRGPRQDQDTPRQQSLSFTEDVEQLPLSAFSERAYLYYSMYVVRDRALPHISDGLKPVQRRIVYAMSELGLSAAAKFKKSARTVGDVLGKYHPHGDTACYEAMVLMGQPFSMRYPLVDGQGNWGSPDDPRSFAAMRYTEARLTRYAQVLLTELEQGTVDWKPNFDATLEEPVMLPARLPNVLLNGASGIAVGMATDIPPHNIREVVAACVRLLEHPRTTTAELCEHVLAPDFPTDAEIITPREELREMYETGIGAVRQRARWEREHEAIIITALPYQVSGSRVLEQIAAQMREKKLPMVHDLRDESDHENPTRLVIQPTSNRVDAESLMDHLFATTDLEKQVRVNMNVIGIDGRPRVYGLRELIREWLDFRTATVRRRLQHRLERVQNRLHVLEGLLVAYLNIDEVISIIRNEDEPKSVLIERFALTGTQADAILDLRLRHLARLEEMRIRGEQDELSAEREGIEKTLGSDRRLKRLVRDELLADAEAFGDDRRTPLTERRAAKAMDRTALIPTEPITVVLSQKGWIRAGKGHELDPAGLGYRAGDGLLQAARGRSNQLLVVMDSTGRSYSLPAHELPSARGLGEPLSSALNPPTGATFAGVMLGAEDDLYLLATDAGYGFLVTLGELVTKNRTGKAVLRVPAGAAVLPPQPVSDPSVELVAVATSAGHLLVYAADSLPQLPRGKGVKLINIPSAKLKSGEERVAGIAVLQEGRQLVVHAGKRHRVLGGGDLTHFEGERALRGRKLPRGFQAVNALEVRG